MANTVGPDGTVTIGIEGDADEAAKRIEEQIAAAFAAALRSPQVKAAFEAVGKRIASSLNKSMGDSFTKPLDSAGKRATRVINGIVNDLQRVAKASQKAFDVGGSSNELKSVNALVSAIASNFEELQNASKQTLRLIEEEGRLSRAALAGLNQEQRRATDQTIQNQRARSAQLQKEQTEISSNARIAAAQITAQGQRTVQVYRTIRQVVTSTWQAGLDAVKGFARTTISAINNIGRAVSATFRAAGQTVAAFGRGLGHAFSGLGRGIGTALGGISRAISSALRRDEGAIRSSMSRRERDLANSLQRQSRLVQQSQARTSQGLLGALTGRGVGLGLAGIGGGLGLGGLLSSGFTRAGQEETLQLSFETLLQDAPLAERTLESIAAKARTTSFDFVEMAKAVQQMFAATGDLSRSRQFVDFLADVTALAGGTTDDFARARVGFGRIAQSGRLGAEELNIIEDAIPGIPIGQILADAFFGGDIAAFSAARLSGELGQISADEFFEAYEAGVKERFPAVTGSAERLAGTLTGLANNFRENMSIFGAQIIRLFEGPIKRAFDIGNRGLAALGGFLSGDIFEPVTQLIGPELVTTTPEGLENLRTLRDILFNVAKALGALLALKGVIELFGLLGTVARAALTPVGLLVVAISGIVAAFTLFNRFSDRFARSWSTVLDQIAPLGRAVAQLGRSFRNFFSREVGSGAPSFLTKLGDAFAYVNVWIGRFLVGLREFINVVALAFETGDFQGLATYIGNLGEDLITALFGIDSWTAFMAEQQGGNDFLNLLETTFLGPIVRFFRETVPEALGGVGNFFSNIFNAIFGDGEGGGGPGARFRGEEGGGGSVATRILNVLEDTFLGPVVSFFRGTFSNAVETAVGKAVDIFQTIVDGIEAVWRFLEPILDPLTDAFRDFFRTFQDEGFLGALGSLGRGALDTLGNIGNAILDGINSGVDFVKDEVGPALEPILTAITDWAKETFTPENFAEVGLRILDYLNEIGFWIGKVVTSVPFVAALIGLTASLLTAIAAAVLGAFQGAISNAGQWGDLIVSGVNAAFGDILPDSITDNAALSVAIGLAIVAAVGAGLAFAGKTLATAGKGATAAGPGTGSFSLATLGFSIAGGLFNTIKTTFGALWKGGLALFTNDRSKVVNAAGENTAVGGLGKSIGVGLAAAIGIGFAGYNIGQHVSGPGGVLLSALFGAGTGAAIGASIGLGPGAAIGAIVGGALGAISAAFGQNAKAAEEAARSVRGYVEALQGVTGAGQTNAIGGVIADRLLGDIKALEDWGNALIDSGFNVNDFAQSVIDGTATADSSFVDFLQGMRDQLVETDEISDFTFTNIISAARRLAETGEFTNLDDFLDALNAEISSDDYRDLSDALEAIDFSGIVDGGGDANAVFTFLDQSIKDVSRAFQVLDSEGVLASASIDTVAEAASAVREALAGGATAAEIADILNQADLTTEQRLEALGEISDEIREKFGLARDELERLLNPPTQETSIGGLTNQIVAELPSVANALTSIFEDTEIAPNVQLSQVEGEINSFRDRINNAILTGFENGSIDSQAEFDTFLGGLETQINQANLAPAVRDQLLAVVDQLQDMDLEDFFDLVGLLQSDDSSVAEAQDVVAADVQQALVGAIGSAGAAGGTPMVQAREIGGKIAGEIGAGLEAAKPVIDAALAKATAGGGLGSVLDSKKPTSAGVEVDDSSVAEAQDVVRRTLAVLIGATAQMLRAGANLGAAFTNGLKAGVRDVAGVTAAAAVAGALAAQRFSGLMFQAGVNMGSSLASGIGSQIERAANVAALLAQAAVNAARSRLQISSPSKVFVNIGRDVGRGFIQGIKDGETDMAAALDNAINTAMDKAQQTARQRSADVAAALFEALAPGTLPGGPSATSIQNAFAAIQQQILGLRGGFGQNAAGGFGDTGRGALLEASAAIQAVTRQFTDHVRALAEERAEARRIAADTDPATNLTARQRALLAQGGLQNLNPSTVIGAENRDAIASALEQIRNYGQTALESGQSLDSVIRTMSRYRDELVNQATALGFSSAEIAKLVEGYGLSTAALAEFRRVQLSLDITTAAGSANIQNINEQLLAIREFGAQLIGSGVSAADAARQLRALRDQLIAQATAFGFNATQIAALVNQAGLSDAALAEFIRQLQVFQQEAAGAEQAARDAAAAAAAEEERRRAEEEAANRPGTGTTDPDLPTVIRPEINIYPPYGDPEAMGLTVLNRLAYEGLVG